MTHEELTRRVAGAMRTKREGMLERPLSRCWEELAAVAIKVALEEAADAVKDAGGDNEDYHADAIRELGEPS